MMLRSQLAIRIQLALAVAVLVFGVNSISGAGTDANPGADLFKGGAIRRVTVEIEPDNLAALKSNHRQYARCTVREGDAVYLAVGIHLKGAAGSFREIDDNPALTLSFNRFEPNQRFHGLRKIHLNNSVQDPSYLTELLCGELFEAAGVPAARTTHARVTLNGRDLGLYVLKEGFTRDFLSRNFKDVSGNLYDGGFLKDIADLLSEESENSSTNRADLKSLADAAQVRDPQVRWEKLSRVLDLDRFISLMVVEVLTWHWDGYAMNRNNYRLYHDPSTGKMVFFPHGMDQMFRDADGALVPDMHGLVADAVIRVPEGRRRYLERLRVLFKDVFDPVTLTNRINELYAQIHPSIAALSKEAGRDHEDAVNELRERILKRHQGIRTQLLGDTRPQLEFDEHGVASLENWGERDGGDSVRLERTTDKRGNALLHIIAAKGCRASWRTKVHLEPGRYRFEGRVRASSVSAFADDKGEGAGLRISGRDRVEDNKLTGTSDWKTLKFAFEAPSNGGPVEFICELRANKGEAWFDLESLKLVRE